MIIPFYFTDGNLKIEFKIILDGHSNNHANSILTVIPNYIDFGIETRYINKKLKKMATVYAQLINQYKFKQHIKFSAGFYRIIEEDQGIDQIEFVDLLIYKKSLCSH